MRQLSKNIQMLDQKISKKVYIGSANPVKIECVRIGFKEVFEDISNFEFIGKPVGSGVADQPMDNAETLLGAKNRIGNLKELFPDGDFYVGIEGGIQTRNEEMEVFAWIVIENKGKNGKAQTATFPLPPKIVELINKGVELGHADDVVFRRNNSKQGNGAVGILTNNVIDRVEYYRHAVILALIPFINENLYQS